jgi:hypothetical protein
MSCFAGCEIVFAGQVIRLFFVSHWSFAAQAPPIWSKSDWDQGSLPYRQPRNRSLATIPSLPPWVGPGNNRNFPTRHGLSSYPECVRSKPSCSTLILGANNNDALMSAGLPMMGICIQRCEAPNLHSPLSDGRHPTRMGIVMIYRYVLPERTRAPSLLICGWGEKDSLADSDPTLKID